MPYSNFFNNQLTNNNNPNNIMQPQMMNNQFLPQMHVIRVNG